MKRFRDRFDPKFMKVSKYVIFSAVVIFIICLILYNAQGFFGDVWRVIKAVLVPIAYGAVICYLLTPITNFLARRLNGKSETQKGWVRPVAVVLTILIVLALIIGLILLLGGFLVNGLKSISFNDISGFFSAIKEEFSGFAEGIEKLLRDLNISSDNLESIVSKLISGIGGFIADLFASLPKAATTILFAVIFSIYFLLDGKRIGDYLKRVFKALSGEKTRNRFRVFLQDADNVFSGYIRGKILDAIVIAVITSAAFSIARVPYAVVAGVFTGVVIIIPYVGSVVSYLILFLAYLVKGDFSGIWVALIILTVILVFEAYILCPKLISKSIVIHPLLIIVALIAGGAVGGLIGMLIGIPVVALIKIEFDRYIERREQDQEKQES